MNDGIKIGDHVAFICGDDAAYTGEVIAVRGEHLVIEYGEYKAVTRKRASQVAKGLSWDWRRESPAAFAGRVSNDIRVRELKAELARLEGK